MEDQQNSNPQPGQTFQPGQTNPPPNPVQANGPVPPAPAPVTPQASAPVPAAPQPTAPVPPQPAPPSPTPLQQQPPSAPVAPQPVAFQRPAPVPQFAQAPQPIAPTTAKPKWLKPKFLIIAGVALVVIVSLAVVLLSSGSSNTASLPLEQTSVEALPFNVQLPVGWTTTDTVLTSYSLITAKPADVTDTDETSIAVALDTSTVAKEDFIKNVNAEIERIGTQSFQDIFNVTISNIESKNYGGDAQPAFWLTYDRTNNVSNTIFHIKNYFISQADGSTVSARFTYSDVYADLAGSTDAILASFSLKAN